jgi:hypothetical protein
MFTRVDDTTVRSDQGYVVVLFASRVPVERQRVVYRDTAGLSIELPVTLREGPYILVYGEELTDRRDVKLTHMERMEILKNIRDAVNFMGERCEISHHTFSVWLEMRDRLRDTNSGTDTTSEGDP